MESNSNLTPEQASEVAAHKARSAKMADEISRDLHLKEAIAKTAAETEASVLRALKEVFGQGDEKRDPEQMNIMVRRIPLICQDVKQIHTDMADIKSDISTINDNLKWGVRLVLGAVLAAVLGLVLIH